MVTRGATRLQILLYALGPWSRRRARLGLVYLVVAGAGSCGAHSACRGGRACSPGQDDVRRLRPSTWRCCVGGSRRCTSSEEPIRSISAGSRLGRR